jgi:hypothetical protein
MKQFYLCKAKRIALFCKTDKFTKYRTLPLKRDNLIFGVYLILGGKVHLAILPLSLSLSPREVQNLAGFVTNLDSLTV